MNIQYNFNRSREHSPEKLNTGGSGKLYVGNLQFTVQENDVKQEFEQLFGPVLDVKIIRKNVSGISFKETNYGFIHMKNVEQADFALNNFTKISQQPWNVSTYNDKTKMKPIMNFNLFPNFQKLNLFQEKVELPMMQRLQQGGLQVREIFVGNLNPDCTQKSVDSSLKTYGQIEQVDFFQKIPPFAFVKFRKVSYARAALEDQKTISILLQSGNLRMQFADHEKRPAIVGDSFGFEDEAELSNFIYIGVHGSITLQSEKSLKQELERYAEVKQLFIKQSNFQLNGQRSFILGELANTDQVKKVYRKYQEENRSGERRKRLGDFRCDIQMVLKPITKSNNFVPIPQFSSLGQNIQPPIQAAPEQGAPQDSDNFLNMLSQMIQEKPEEKEEEIKNTFWSGFFTRSKQNRVGVDATMLEGKEPNFHDFNLNVSHRIKFDEILKKNVQCLVIFTPSNETQVKQFQEYITYFTQKQRAGVISLREISLYIMPKVEEIKNFTQLTDNQILGIFCDSNPENNRINFLEFIQKKPLNETNQQQEQFQNGFDLLNVLPLLDNPDFQKALQDI